MTILEQNVIASSLTSEGNTPPVVSDPKSLHCIPEGGTVVSDDQENAHPLISLKQSLEQPKETSGFHQIHTTPFHFSYQQSHRTVAPNLSISSSPSTDCRDVMSNSARSPFLGRMLRTDLVSVTPVPSELCSNQVISDNSEVGFSEICPVLTVLAPSSSELSQSIDERLMDVELKPKPMPVHADSLESDSEFFDCQYTLSDVSEPELKSEELFESETVFHVEESPSLPSTPAYDYLSVTPKITERSEFDSQDSPRPVSWESEEIDLPIVFEPEDECVAEHDEEIAYRYGYADEHPCAEELPPRQGGQYDEDDDSLGRVSFDHE